MANWGLMAQGLGRISEALANRRQMLLDEEQRKRQGRLDSLNEQIQNLNMDIARANLGETQELRKRRNLLLDAQANLLEAEPGVMERAQPFEGVPQQGTPAPPQLRSPGAALGLPGMPLALPGNITRAPAPAPAPLMSGMPAGPGPLPGPEVQSELDPLGRLARTSPLWQTKLGQNMMQMAALEGRDMTPGLAMAGIRAPSAPLQFEEIPGIGRIPINAPPGVQQEVLRQQGRERDSRLVATITEENYPGKKFKDLSLEDRVSVLQQAGLRGLSLEAAEVATLIQTEIGRAHV